MWKGSLVFSSTRNLRMNSWNWDEKTLQVFACASHNQRIKDASNDFYSRLQVAVDFLFFQSHFLTHFSLSCLLVNRITTWTFYPCSGFQLVRKWFLMIFFPSFECLEIYFSFHSLFFYISMKMKKIKVLIFFLDKRGYQISGHKTWICCWKKEYDKFVWAETIFLSSQIFDYSNVPMSSLWTSKFSAI